MSGPLSHAQQRRVLAERLDPGNADNKVVGGYLLRGELRVDALRAALCDVVERHAILRTVYGWDGNRGVQTVQPAASARPHLEVLPPVDLATSGGLAAIAVTVCADWWVRRFDLEHGPVLWARLVPVGDGAHLLCLAVHHVAFDGWSGSVFRDDLATAYAARCAGTEPDWAPRADYADYVAWERRQIPRWLRGDLPYWQGVLGEPADPVVTADPAVSEAPSGGYGVELAAKVVLGLHERGRGLGASPLALLLHAVGGVLAGWSGAGRIGVGTVFSGRWEPRYRRVVGCFVNAVPVVVPADHGADLPVRLRALTRAVLDALRHSRTPMNEVVTRLGGGPGPHLPGGVLVILNARYSAAALGGGVAMESAPVLPPRTSSPLIVETVPRADGGWRLRARWRRDSLSDERGRELVTAVEEFLVGVSGE